MLNIFIKFLLNQFQYKTGLVVNKQEHYKRVKRHIEKAPRILLVVFKLQSLIIAISCYFIYRQHLLKLSQDDASLYLRRLQSSPIYKALKVSDLIALANSIICLQHKGSGNE